MTLADFARSIGVSPATARQWKRRGKIVAREGGFELIAEAQREWVGIAGRDTGVALHSAQDSQYMFDSKFRIPQHIPPPVKVPPGRVTDSAQDSRLCRREAEVGERQPESHRGSCADCGKQIESESDWPVCKSCHAVNPRLDRIEVLERDNRILSDAVDSLRDLTTEHGRKLSDLQRDNATLQRFIDGLGDRVTALEAKGAIDPPSVHWGA